MTRSVREVWDALWEVCDWNPEASTIVERFRRDAMFLHWDESRPLPVADEMIDIADDQIEYGDVLVYLVKACSGEHKEPIAWRARARNFYDRSVYRLLFVDAKPCHPDWLALRLFSEVVLLYDRRCIDDVIRGMDPILPPLDDDALTFLLQGAMVHLEDQRSRLLFRLLDRRMRGRVTDTVTPMRERLPPAARIKDMVHSLSEDVYDQLIETWDPPRNRAERRIRAEVTRNATLGAVKQILGPRPRH